MFFDFLFNCCSSCNNDVKYDEYIPDCDDMYYYDVAIDEDLLAIPITRHN